MSDVPPDLNSALIGRYSLEGVIGHGGMATVYLARDDRHARQVAVKVLRPEISAAIGTERFLREIEIAAQLNHPHILTLIDSGEAAGFLYYVMPYVEGETLRGRLLREKRMELGTALPIVAETADALDYAHRQGVVHRDIKPENILLSEGHAVVADFGIAKAVVSAGGAALTRSGFPLGTPGYMSPEQAAGLTDLDARTDVYSLACVTYELLIGETPGMWLPDDAVELRYFVDSSPGHRERLDRLPGAVEQVLVRALAMRSALRFATPGEFAAALGASSHGPRVGGREAKELVRRAAEIQAARPTAGDQLSLAGVERLAAEVGIPPADVRAAAGELQAPMGEIGRGGILGTSPQLDFERVVPGTLSQSDHGAVLEEIRITLGDIGQLNETLGESLLWSSKPSGYRTQVLVSSDTASTRIRISDNEAAPGAIVMVPIAAVSAAMFGITGAVLDGMGAGTLGTVVAAAGVSTGLFGTGWAVARAWFRRQVMGRRDKISLLMRRLEGLASGRGARAELPRPDKEAERPPST